MPSGILDLSKLLAESKKASAEKAKKKSDQLLHRKVRTPTVAELRRRKPVEQGTYEAARVRATLFNHICVRCKSQTQVLAKIELVKVNTHDPLKTEMEILNSQGAFDFYSDLPMVSTISDRYMPACPTCIEERSNG